MPDSTTIKEVLVDAGSDLVTLGDDIRMKVREFEAAYHGLVRVSRVSIRRAETIAGQSRVVGIELAAELVESPAVLRGKKGTP